MAIFVDYLGPAEAFAAVRGGVAQEVSRALRCPVDQVVVRRLVTEGGAADHELWVELSSDEQLYRVGRQLAGAITARLQQAQPGANVWVMYRVVPLSHAFLNGAARGRGTPGFE